MGRTGGDRQTGKQASKLASLDSGRLSHSAKACAVPVLQKLVQWSTGAKLENLRGASRLASLASLASVARIAAGVLPPNHRRTEERARPPRGVKPSPSPHCEAGVILAYGIRLNPTASHSILQ